MKVMFLVLVLLSVSCGKANARKTVDNADLEQRIIDLETRLVEVSEQNAESMTKLELKLIELQQLIEATTNPCK